jgi:hypothetical protein
VNGVALSSAQQETFATPGPSKAVNFANCFGRIVVERFDFQFCWLLANCRLSVWVHGELQYLRLLDRGPNQSHVHLSGGSAEERFVRGTVTIEV